MQLPFNLHVDFLCTDSFSLSPLRSFSSVPRFISLSLTIPVSLSLLLPFLFSVFFACFFWPSLHINFSSVVIKNCFWGCCVSYSKLVPFTFFSSSLLLLLVCFYFFFLLHFFYYYCLIHKFSDEYRSGSWVSLTCIHPGCPFGRCQRLLIVNEEKCRESN